MNENWEDLSKHSRTELLSGFSGKDFDRIIHNRAWEANLDRLLFSKNAIKVK